MARSSYSSRPRHNRTVASATSTEPPAASAHKRPASMAAGPNQSSPLRTMSPLLTPTRKPSSLPPITRRRATACSATAASRAAAALVKEAITPSPRPFTNLPPDAATTSALARSSSAMRTSATLSPSRTRHAVEPTTSLKRTVTVSGRSAAIGHIRATPRYALVEGRSAITQHGRRAERLTRRMARRERADGLSTPIRTARRGVTCHLEHLRDAPCGRP